MSEAARTDVSASKGNRDSVPSQFRTDDYLYVPKGPNFVQKKPTRIVQGGPSNMEKRVNTRQNRSRDPQVRRESRMNDTSAYSGADGSTIYSMPSNFISMKANDEKAY